MHPRYFPDRPLSDYEFSTRVMNCLKLACLSTAGEVANRTDAQLTRMPHFGRLSLIEVRSMIPYRGKAPLDLYEMNGLPKPVAESLEDTIRRIVRQELRYLATGMVDELEKLL